MPALEPRTIAVAIHCAAYIARRLDGWRDREALIRDEMETRDLPQERFGDVDLIVNAMLSFSDAVRVAEKHNFPIVPHLGEASFQQKR